MTDESKVPDPPSVVMDRFIYAVPTLVKTEESLDRLSQVIVTVFDTLFIAPLSQRIGNSSTQGYTSVQDVTSSLHTCGGAGGGA